MKASVSTTEQLIADLQTLPLAEVERVRQAIDEILSAKTNEPLMTEDEFERYLAAKGVISLPAPMTEEEQAREYAESDAYEPIEVEGKPLSQIIIEERR